MLNLSLICNGKLPIWSWVSVSIESEPAAFVLFDYFFYFSFSLTTRLVSYTGAWQVSSTRMNRWNDFFFKLSHYFLLCIKKKGMKRKSKWHDCNFISSKSFSKKKYPCIHSKKDQTRTNALIENPGKLNTSHFLKTKVTHRRWWCYPSTSCSIL